MHTRKSLKVRRPIGGRPGAQGTLQVAGRAVSLTRPLVDGSCHDFADMPREFLRSSIR